MLKKGSHYCYSHKLCRLTIVVVVTEEVHSSLMGGKGKGQWVGSPANGTKEEGVVGMAAHNHMPNGIDHPYLAGHRRRRQGQAEHRICQEEEEARVRESHRRHRGGLVKTTMKVEGRPGWMELAGRQVALTWWPMSSPRLADVYRGPG